MKLQLLAAVASAALISAGVVAQAQDNPKHDQRPAAEQSQPKAETAPRAGEAMKPKAAEMQHKEAPKAAETQRKEAPKAAETQHNQAPKAAETQHNQAPKAAEARHDQMQRQGEANAPRRDARDEKGMKTGDKQHEAQRADRPARVTGKVKISSEHAQRVGETLRREGRSEHVSVNIRVGERVPETVVIRPLPEDVISMVPEYRGYDYFVDSDEDIVFVSPQTHEIVGTIGYEGRAAAEDATQVSGARPCPAND